MIKYILSAIFIVMGIVVLATAMVGNFRFGYVLNRMQVGATSDTLGAALIIIGLILTLTHPIWLRNIYKRMMKRRYANLDGFHETRLATTNAP